MKTIKQLLTITAFLLLMQCCHKDPVPDPCANKQPVSAGFKIVEALGYTAPDKWIRYDTDTVLTSGATFTALEAGAQYTWLIGTETITGQSFSRYGFPRGEHIPVTLIIKKTPNTSCFPDDDGIDTITRTFYAGYLSESLLWGTYRGAYTDAPKDSVNIKLEWNCCYGSGTPPNEPIINIVGLGYCDTLGFGYHRPEGLEDINGPIYRYGIFHWGITGVLQTVPGYWLGTCDQQNIVQYCTTLIDTLNPNQLILEMQMYNIDTKKYFNKNFTGIRQ